MKINLAPYIQRAIEQVTCQPVDLSAVRVDICAEFAPDAGTNALDVSTALVAADDAGWQFREALMRAGMDDLRVFELGRAFDQAFGGAQ